MATKKQRSYNIGPIEATGDTKTEARQKAEKSATDIAHVLNMLATFLPLTGIGDVRSVFLVLTTDSIGYGILRDGENMGSQITIMPLEDGIRGASLEAIRHVADLYMGHPWAVPSRVSNGQGWVRKACQAWQCEDYADEIIQAIQHNRIGRAKMVAGQ